MNWPLLIIFGLIAISLLIFLVRRNWKDEKEFEHQLNEDYHKTKDEEGDVDVEEKIK